MSLSNLLGRGVLRLRNLFKKPESVPASDPMRASDPGRGFEPLLHRPYDALNAIPGRSLGETCNDAAMVARLLRAYEASTESKVAGPSAVWRMIYKTRLQPLHRILVDGDVGAVSALLRRPGDNDLFYGFENLFGDMVKSFKESSAYEMGHAKWCQDYLVRVAEAVGALRIENPERRGSNPTYGTMPTDEILAAIEEAVGCEIRFPNPYPDEFGLKTKRGVASIRAIHAIYQAWRIRELVRHMPHPRVLELGAGLGRTAFYARQLGISDYTIIDLPLTALSQGYFLMRTLGEDQVALQEEHQGGASAKVKILNPAAFLESSESYDLIVNVDSLTEMNRSTAELYWKRIEASARLFLSINHEANEFTVKELIDRSSRIASRHRHPYWVRHGYVEELVSFQR
ncbi:MAG TPA: putative sugar O-methyltransferase [Burkholderiales bacterium]|nr:putative sugar O-methyltransferase [Burkholderiales bacterium]